MENLEIISVTNNGEGPSFFSSKEIILSGDDMRMLSEQQAAVNFRLRTSGSNYSSNYHVAGDPTLLIILKGQLRVSLPNGETKDFSAGEMFIAEDYLKEGIGATENHGHKAEVIGEAPLNALHLKLAKR